MKLASTWMCVIGLFIIGASASLAASPGACLNDEETTLLTLIDQYRVSNSLPKIPWSKSLTKVAQWHVIDATQNKDSVFSSTCNLHSWSNMQPTLWSALCYTSDHAQASKMWSKPKEITDGVFRSNGYEIAGQGYASVAAVLSGWQNSSGHNAVILNQGGWSSFPWKSMGVGVDSKSRYYYVWFSNAVDSQGAVQTCSEPATFDNGFE